MTKPTDFITNTIPSSNNDENGLYFHLISIDDPIDDFLHPKQWITRQEALQYWPETPDD